MIIAFIILAASVPTKPLTDIRQETAAYYQCVRTSSVKLERSDAPIEQITSAALVACIQARERVSDVFGVDLSIRESNLTTGQIVGRTDRFLALLDEDVRKKASLVVLQRRAERKSHAHH